MNATGRMPVLFVGHGSPMSAIEQNPYTAGWAALGRSLPRPKAILAVSAHWYDQGTAVTAMERPQTIHDFYGFPKPLYEVQYPAPGDPALAHRIRALLAPADVALDHEWGLDHGSWSVLIHMYPHADVPVVQLKIDRSLSPAEHYALAKRLAPLRDEGVLVMGSGNIVHNLRTIRWQPNAAPFDWATRFNDRVRALVLAHEHATLIENPSDDDTRRSVPTPEHYLPLLYCLALQEAEESVEIPIDGIDLGSISMQSIRIGG